MTLVWLKKNSGNTTKHVYTLNISQYDHFQQVVKRKVKKMYIYYFTHVNAQLPRHTHVGHPLE